MRTKLLLATVATLAGLVATAAPAVAAPVAPASSGLTGTTSVTTAPGIATALIGGGVLPLPQLPKTGFRIGYSGGLNVTYGFPVVGGKPDLSGPSGNILHVGGVTFVSRRGSLAIGNFDIDLAKGKIYATKVNGAAARLPVFTLDLAGLKVTTPPGRTVLSGISLKLTAAAAGALNSTFGLHLPTDGSLVFGSAEVSLNTGS